MSYKSLLQSKSPTILQGKLRHRIQIAQIAKKYDTSGGWYENREAISPLTMKEMPNHVKALLWSARVHDFQPTRG